MDNKKRQRIKAIYDKFETKDMSFDDFLKAFTALAKPVSPQEMLEVRMEAQIAKARADSNSILTRNRGLILPNKNKN